MFEEIGKQLREFHTRYGNKQHGDFQHSNIFYDELANRVTFIDISGKVCKTSFETDLDRFCCSLAFIGNFYGPRFSSDGKHHLEKGYSKQCPTSMCYHVR